MHINYKNVLAGVGGLAVLTFILILGLFSKADENSLYEDNLIASEEICPYDNYDLYANYPIPTNSLIKIGVSIYIDSTGRLFSIFMGNNKVETFDKENGKDYKVFADKDTYKPDSVNNLSGMYIDELRGIVYIPGQGGLVNLYRYDLSGNPLKTWEGVRGKSVGGFADYIFVSPSTKETNLEVFLLKKYDINGNKIKTIKLPFAAYDVYPDMTVGKDGTIYVPMNVEQGIFDKNPKTGKYDILVGYEYVSTILRYDQNLVMIDAKIENSPFYKRQEKREVINGVVQKFKEDEKEQTFARVNIDKDGNLVALLKNRTDLDTNGYSRQNVFKIYKPDGTFVKGWQAPGYHFYDFDSDSEGNFFAATIGNIYKFKTKCGEITIEKNVNNNALDSFVFSKDFLDKNNFTLQDKAKNTFDIWEAFDENTTFTVREEFNPKYNPSVSCDDISGQTITNQNIVKIKLNKENAGEVYCTFLNEAKKGKLIIKKIEEPNTGRVFDFDLVNPTDYVNGILETFSLSGGNEKEFVLEDGSYNIREHILSGYITKIECEVDGHSIYRPFVSKTPLDPEKPNNLEFNETEVQVYMQKGIIVTCTFTNTKTNGLQGSTNDSISSPKEE